MEKQARGSLPSTKLVRFLQEFQLIIVIRISLWDCSLGIYFQGITQASCQASGSGSMDDFLQKLGFRKATG